MSVILLDANNLAHRVIAVQSSMSVNEINTGSLVLFINTLSRYVRMLKPERGLVCWDSGQSAYRTRIYPAYKQNRKQGQADKSILPIAFMQKFLKLAGFPQLQLPGYEADDLIAASWRACRGRERIFILSSDKDLAQLIDATTDKIDFTPNTANIWDRARWIREKGYKPEHQAYYLALKGDSSDNIPGLTGIGDKKAIKKLADADWDMTKLLNSLSRADQDRVLINIALIDLSLVPLTLRTPPILDLVNPSDTRWGPLEEFCQQWQLNKICEKLRADRLWHN